MTDRLDHPDACPRPACVGLLRAVIVHPPGRDWRIGVSCDRCGRGYVAVTEAGEWRAT